MIHASLFGVFFRIGIVSFGGGYAMLPLIFQSVERFGVMGASEFARFVALSQATPGPISVNAATYTGFYAAGIPGALAATAGIVAPSFLCVLAVLRFMERFEKSRALQSALAGIRPVTVGLIASAAVFMADSTLTAGRLISERWLIEGVAYLHPIPCAIFAGALLLGGKFKLNTVAVMLLAAAAGALLLPGAHAAMP
ncbi:MAG: chromate transporter [Clostridiales Family XIII bacterium]|jgi:chromate transporter|nr:chromate transporter [Clostridiales Family XIII bacterium]